MSKENDDKSSSNDVPEPLISVSPSNEGSQGSNSNSSGMGSFVDAFEDLDHNADPNEPPSDNSSSSLVMVEVQDDSAAEGAPQKSNSGDNENDESDSSGLLQESDASSLVPVDAHKGDTIEETPQEPQVIDSVGPPSDSSSSSLVVVDAEEDGVTEETPSEPIEDAVEEKDVSETLPTPEPAAVQTENADISTTDDQTENADVSTTDDLDGVFISGGLVEKDEHTIKDVIEGIEQKVDQSEGANLESALQEEAHKIPASTVVANDSTIADRPSTDREGGTGASPEVTVQSSDGITGTTKVDEIPNMAPTIPIANQSIAQSGTDLLNIDAEKNDSEDGVLIDMTDVTERADISSILPSSDPSMLRKVPARATKPVIPEIAYSRPETSTTEDSEHNPLTTNLSNDVSHFTAGSQMTTASQTTRHHSNSKRNIMYNAGGNGFPEPARLGGNAMASVNEKISTEDNNPVPTPYDEWAARQGCAPPPPPPPVIDDFEMVNMDKEMRSKCQPHVVKTTGSGGSSGSASSAAPTETFEKVAPVKALNGFFVDMGRLIVVGVLSLVGGAVSSLFANRTCDFGTISKPVGYYGEVLNVQVGMNEFTSMDSVFQGQSFCIPYSHDYYSLSPPLFARACGTFALVMGSLASVTVWHYIFTEKAYVPLWNMGIFFATSAALSQLLTFQFFWSPVCENEACGLGAGSIASLVATAVYAYSAFEMQRNSPVRGIGAINQESLLSDAEIPYKAPELV